MEWTITLNEEKGFAEVITKGIADKDGSLAMVKAISSTLRDTAIKKVLVDHRNIDMVSGMTVDVYNRPKELDKMKVPKTIKVAEIIRPEHMEFFSFLETVCINSGYNFLVFTDDKSAMEWLLK